MKEKKTHFFSLRKREKDKFRFGFTSTYIIMVGVISILFLYYIVSRNITATKSYQIVDLDETQRELRLELERLDVKIAELESLDNIMKDPAANDMVPAEDPDYLVIKEGVQYTYKN